MAKNTAPRADLMDKEPSKLHENYAAWLKTQTGYRDVDLKTVQLAVTLRMDFQRSDTNQQHLAERRKAKEAREAAKAAKAAAPKKATKAPAKKAAAKDEVSAKRAAKKATPAKPAKRASGSAEPPF